MIHRKNQLGCYNLWWLRLFLVPQVTPSILKCFYVTHTWLWHNRKTLRCINVNCLYYQISSQLHNTPSNIFLFETIHKIIIFLWMNRYYMNGKSTLFVMQSSISEAEYNIYHYIMCAIQTEYELSIISFYIVVIMQKWMKFN